MAGTYHTTGIILKRRNFQENDRLFCVFTKDYGKIDLLAKGTKKITSKLNSYLEPMYFIKVMAAKGKVIDKLANCNLIEPYQNLREDKTLIGFYILNYLSEVTDGLIEGQIVDPNKFDLLLAILEILNQEIVKDNSREKLLLLSNIYFLKLLNLLGYQPEIQRCLVCHKGLILTKNIFDFSQGGIICESCKKVCLIEDYIEVSDNVIKIFQLAQENEIKYFTEIKIKSEDMDLFDKVIHKLLLVNIERSINTYEFI